MTTRGTGVRVNCREGFVPFGRSIATCLTPAFDSSVESIPFRVIVFFRPTYPSTLACMFRASFFTPGLCCYKHGRFLALGYEIVPVRAFISFKSWRWEGLITIYVFCIASCSSRRSIREDLRKPSTRTAYLTMKEVRSTLNVDGKFTVTKTPTNISRIECFRNPLGDPTSKPA